MLTASVAELEQACKADGAKASGTSCRLAATQKRALEELQAATTPKASQPGSLPAGRAGAPGVVAAVPAVATPAAAAPAVPASAAVATSAAAPAAPASAATPPQPANAGNDEAAIVAEVGIALQTWRERWQDGDVDGYLGTYAPSYTGGAASRGEWEQQRRQKMKNARPSIRVEKLEAARVTPQEVELRFVQVYSASRHRDRGHKTMVFQRTPQGWLIVDERWVKAS